MKHPEEVLAILQVEELTRGHPQLKDLHDEALRALIEINDEVKADAAKAAVKQKEKEDAARHSERVRTGQSGSSAGPSDEWGAPGSKANPVLPAGRPV